MNRFEFTDPDGDRLVAEPARRDDDIPAVALMVLNGTAGGATLHVPLAHLEEVVAGLRDMARQTGGQPPVPARRTLTEGEHDRAWHAIEGLDWDDADPDTVLNAVLAALGIDPPGVQPDPCSGCRYVPCGTCVAAAEEAGAKPEPRPTVVIHEKPAEAPIVVVRPGTEGWIRA